MPNVAEECLVLLELPGADDALAQLRAFAVVTHVLAPRLALVRADAEALERIATIRGVGAVHCDAMPTLEPPPTPAERAFVAAWAMRRRPKIRRGDGLSWDAPGFDAPDLPKQDR